MNNDVTASKRIGFVSTRFAGTDGVSLETEKWANVLERMGCECFYFCGVCDRLPEISYVVPEAFFQHPTIDAINQSRVHCHMGAGAQGTGEWGKHRGPVSRSFFGLHSPALDYPAGAGTQRLSKEPPLPVRPYVSSASPHRRKRSDHPNQPAARPGDHRVHGRDWAILSSRTITTFTGSASAS